MKEYCSPAKHDQIGAIYVYRTLIIWAKVTAPNQFYYAGIKRNPAKINPPMYDLDICHKGFVPQVYNPTQLSVVSSFDVPQPNEDHVPVNTSEGRIEVPLFVLAPIPFDPTEAISHFSATGSDRNLQPASSIGASGMLSLPVNMSKVFETGNSEAVEIPESLDQLQIVRATGYSYAFSFDEAFQDAVSNLPPDDRGIMDWLTTVHVESIGAEYGGIAGIMRMRVSVYTIR